jgi:hypothetical protein
LNELLEKTSSASPYEVPSLGLKRDSNHAHTAQDVEPFSGAQPFKEHLLEQMEYAGAARSIPEPTDVRFLELERLESTNLHAVVTGEMLMRERWCLIRCGRWA